MKKLCKRMFKSLNELFMLSAPEKPTDKETATVKIFCYRLVVLSRFEHL